MLKVTTFSRSISVVLRSPARSGGRPSFSPSHLPRVPRPCRVLCDRAGVLTFPILGIDHQKLAGLVPLLRPRSYHATMPWGLKRYQKARCLHFVTFSCYARAPRLASPHARDLFEKTF